MKFCTSLPLITSFKRHSFKMHSEQCRLENTYLFSVLVNCWVLFLHLTSAFISFYPKWNIFFFSPKLQRRFLWGTGRKTYHFNEYPRNISLSPSVALSCLPCLHGFTHSTRLYYLGCEMTFPKARNNILDFLNPYSSYIGALRRKCIRRTFVA